MSSEAVSSDSGAKFPVSLSRLFSSDIGEKNTRIATGLLFGSVVGVGSYFAEAAYSIEGVRGLEAKLDDKIAALPIHRFDDLSRSIAEIENTVNYKKAELARLALQLGFEE